MTQTLGEQQYLARILSKSDVYRYALVASGIATRLDEIATEFRNGTFEPRLRSKIGHRKSLIWSAATIGDSLALRHLARQIRSASGIISSDRNEIVLQLREILNSEPKGIVLRTDIRKCFHSINPVNAIEQAQLLSNLPLNDVHLLECYLLRAGRPRPRGLPWGIAPSGAMADLFLSEFDRACRCIEGVTYYARFVDDIVIVSSSTDSASLIKLVKDVLPSGLALSANKTAPIEYGSKWNTPPRFDFLGYRFLGRQVSPQKQEVCLQMAGTKLSRLKIKVSAAFHRFDQDDNVFDLRRRIRLLTGNVAIRTKRYKSRLRVGIYFNYRLVTDLSHLKYLDAHLRGCLRNARKNILKRSHGLVYFKSIQRCSFHAGHHNKITHTWDYATLVRLRRAWRR